MQHNAPFGYPSPPASPAYETPRCNIPSQPLTGATRPFQPRCVPLAPEERLGKLLEGKLQLTEILGTGAYGVVYAALDVKTGVRYAVKCLSKFNADGAPLERRQVAYQQREIRLHYLASAHRNVVSMYKIVEDQDCVYVILEYCPEGDLFLNITERGQYVGRDDLSRNIFLQILDAVEHCHKLGIYHRDLKPENILVTDQGETVKLADFGLATSEDRSEDYGCGSTFYMSPECLDPSSRKPYYMCAPNDVWSLGVILVNLTCGRNPWKQASFQDSTYRAYARSQEFLKTILPLTDDLNDILGRIFEPSPERRITLPELRERIFACRGFTIPPAPVTLNTTTPPGTPEHMTDYAVPPCSASVSEDAILDDYDYDYETPSSPASTFSDDGSLTSSGSTIDDMDEDFIREQQEMAAAAAAVAAIPHHQDYMACGFPQDKVQDAYNSPAFHPGMPQSAFPGQEFVPQHYTGPVPLPTLSIPQSAHHQVHSPISPISPLSPLTPVTPMSAMQAPLPSQPAAAPCASRAKLFFPLWDVVRYVQQVPMMHPHQQQQQHHPGAFYQQMPLTFQGCH
jgi:serine/threonine protein kinase